MNIEEAFQKRPEAKKHYSSLLEQIVNKEIVGVEFCEDRHGSLQIESLVLDNGVRIGIGSVYVDYYENGQPAERIENRKNVYIDDNGDKYILKFKFETRSSRVFG